MIAGSKAPSFPHAAEKPCADPLTVVGKTSAAARKVTVLGPNWLKNEERLYKIAISSALIENERNAH